MRWGLFTSGYARETLESAFRDAAAFHYSYIELWGGRPHAYAPDLLRSGAKEVLQLIERYGMPVEIYTPEHNAYPYNYMLGDDAQFQDCMDYFEQALRCGRLLGAEYVLFSIAHGGKQPPEQRRQRLGRAAKAVREMAERLGQKVLWENLSPFESNQCTRLKDYADFLSQTDSPMISGMCDVVVPFVQGEEPLEYLKELGPRMAHLHLADSDGESETHYLPGAGKMDLASLIRSYEEQGYRGRVTIELVTHYIEEPHEAARQAVREICRQIESRKGTASSERKNGKRD